LPWLDWLLKQVQGCGEYIKPITEKESLVWFRLP
jgi:hypothetical protein